MVNVLEQDDLDKLVQAAQKSRRPLHAAIVTTLAYTGLRVGELCGLTLSTLKLGPSSGELIIKHRMGCSRQVSLNVEVCRHLCRYIAVRPTPDRAGNDRVFINQRGEAVTPSGVWRILAKYAQSMGLSGVSPRTLRHTFAVCLLRQGQSLDFIADALGHENVSTTTVLYGKQIRNEMS